MAVPIRPFWPTLANSINFACKYITRHRATLLSVLATVSPTDVPAAVAAFAAIDSACALFVSIQQHIDPNWKPE